MDLVFLGQEEVSVQVLLVGQEEVSVQVLLVGQEELEEVSVVELVAGLEQGRLEEEWDQVFVGQGVASVELWAME